MTAATISERVAAGAAFLDEREPGWWERIDLGKLSIGSHCQCILGQLHESYGRGMRALDLYYEGGPDSVGLGFFWAAPEPQSAPLGEFEAWAAAEYQEIDDLTAEWRGLIEGRRATGPGAAPPA